MSTTPPPIPQPAHAPTPPPLPRKGKGSKRATIVIVAAAVLLLGWIGYSLVGVVNTVAKAYHNAATGREHVVAAPEYEPLIGEGLAGSGFHFHAGNAVYLCTSLHQFDGKMPAEMISLDFDAPIKITGLVHKQNDVQVLSFESEELNQIAPLPYSNNAAVNAGLPVYLYSDEGPIKGHVTVAYLSKKIIRIKTDKPFTAAGQSGSPVIHGETGAVIAVLLGANDAEHATRVEAELLQLP